MGLLAGMVTTYVLMGLFLGPTFLLSDVQNKYEALADTVTRTLTVFAEVLAPPVKPIVTVSDSCPIGVLSVVLEWPNDRGSFSYDVFRDGAPLVTGLPQPSYSDTAVLPNTPYSYRVVAHGPMGSGIAESDAVLVTTPADCESLLLPQIQIMTLGESNVSLVSTIQYTGNLQPLITGTTNKPEATVDVSLVGGQQSMYASFTTNTNGYWEWPLPEAMTVDTSYLLTATVTDPLYPDRHATDTLTIVISAPSPLPQIQILSVGSADVSAVSTIQYSGSLQPIITGTANKQNAPVAVSLVGGSQTLHGSVTTRPSGYWEWPLPEAMIVDTSYLLTATVTDPLYPDRHATDTLTIVISAPSPPPSEEDTGGSSSHHHKGAGETTSTVLPLPTGTLPKPPPTTGSTGSGGPVLVQDMYIPIQLSLVVTNPESQVFQNRDLGTQLTIVDLEKQFVGMSVDVTYRVIDPSGKEVLTRKQTLVLRSGAIQEEAVLVPFSWGDGEYHVRADVRAGQTLVSGETRFFVRLLPIFDFGGGIAINWNSFMSFIGWVISLLLLLLFLFFFAFSREYMLYLHSTRHITERMLFRKGFFGPRKGVWP